RRLGPGHSGEGAAPEPVLEVPPEAVEPSVDFIEPSERRGRLRQARLLCSCIRLGLALHDDPTPRLTWRPIYVYAVLYKQFDSSLSSQKPAVASCAGLGGGPRLVSRFTVIGMASLLNSIQAISIGSTTPVGTSIRIGEPMLICSARAPMIRAFSNRV